jgi:hypothetical protein
MVDISRIYGSDKVLQGKNSERSAQEIKLENMKLKRKLATDVS